jgi:hypothetical protein
VAWGAYTEVFSSTNNFYGNSSSTSGFAETQIGFTTRMAAYAKDTFLVFDLSQVNGTISALSLLGAADSFMTIPGMPDDFDYDSIEGRIGSVSVPLSDLETIHPLGQSPGPGDAGTAIFQAIQSGTDYGGFKADNGVQHGWGGNLVGPDFSALLNADGLAAAQAAQASSTLFVIGLSGYGFSSISAGGAIADLDNLRLSGRSVPEPSSVFMLAVGALGTLGHVWRRRRVVGVR